jgi:CBS domain-containing protein
LGCIVRDRDCGVKAALAAARGVELGTESAYGRRSRGTRVFVLALKRGEPFMSMQVAELMTQPVITATAATPLAEAIGLMLEHRISGLPVVDENGRLCGMLSEGDLLRRTETGTAPEPSSWRALLAGPERLARWYVRTHGRRVGELMTREVICVAALAPLAQAVELMQAHEIKRLPVLSADGEFVGIISRADVLRGLARLLAQQSRDGSDELIRRRVEQEFAAQRWLARGSVDVSVRDGTVELRGMVFGSAQRDALRVLLENIPGVRHVQDHLVWVEPYTGSAVALPPEHTSG